MKTDSDTLQNVIIPGTSISLAQVAELKESAHHLYIGARFPIHTLSEALLKNLQTQDPNLSITLESKIVRHAIQHGPTAHPRIKNIIAIASGKGGVGKSTVSTNIAVLLHQMGARVGLLDADIYGPSQPTLLNVHHAPQSKDQKTIEPILQYGILTMSIGYLIDTEQAIIWRGPMVSTALQQLLRDTQWPELDYLIIDLPPGTGDIQLTLAQKIPVSGAVIVTTPQDLALQDVRRAVQMFKKVGIPILGVVENMSSYHCPACGHADDVFGEHGGADVAAAFDLPLLGQIPLSKRIREHSDRGQPIGLDYPEEPLSQAYHDIALALSLRLAIQKRHHGLSLPKVVVEHKPA